MMAKRPHTQRCCICTTPRSKRLTCCTRVRTPSHADTHDLAVTHATRTGAPTARQRQASHVIAAEGGAAVHKIKSTRAFSAHPCGGIRTRTDAPPRAARGPSARASSAPRRTHLGEALELAELRDHAQRALLDAREAKAVVERGGGHRDRRGADGGASPPPLDARGRPAGRRRELPLGRRGGAGGRRVRGVARAAASGVRARIYLSHRAFDIKRRHILTPTRNFGRLEAFHGFIWNAFCKRSDIKRHHSFERNAIRRFGCERNWQLRTGGREKGRMAKGGSAGCRWDRSISCTR